MTVEGDDLRTLARHLRSPSFGRAHEHHVEIDSTNTRAAVWAREGAPHGAVVTADAQRRGRGRRGRAWHSPAGQNLYASLILRPGRVGPHLGAIGLAVAVGLREALPRPAEIALKWPNDLLVGERKLGGILCESRWCGDVPELVVGFGINVHTTTFPDDLASAATSLALLLPGAEVPRRPLLLASLLASLEDVLATFFSGGFAAIRTRYEPHCTALGREVTLAEGSRTRRVVAEGLDHDGALLVRSEDGPLERVEAADVWLSPDPVA